MNFSELKLKLSSIFTYNFILNVSYSLNYLIQLFSKYLLTIFYIYAYIIFCFLYSFCMCSYFNILIITYTYIYEFFEFLKVVILSFINQTINDGKTKNCFFLLNWLFICYTLNKYLIFNSFASLLLIL